MSNRVQNFPDWRWKLSDAVSTSNLESFARGLTLLLNDIAIQVKQGFDPTIRLHDQLYHLMIAVVLND
jgi:hypothetical protein